jgi:hypothetical protein
MRGVPDHSTSFNIHSTCIQHPFNTHSTSPKPEVSLETYSKYMNFSAPPPIKKIRILLTGEGAAAFSIQLLEGIGRNWDFGRC